MFMSTEEFVKKRDEILINFETMNDKELLIALLKLNSNNIPSSPEVARIGLHKARLYSKGVPIELREYSRNWLAEHNYSEDIY